MKECNIGDSMIELLKYVNAKTNVQFKTNKTIGRSVQTERGVPQGCCVAPATFIIFANMILQELNDTQLAYPVGYNQNTDKQDYAVLFYADDLLIVCDCPHKMQQIIDRCLEIMDVIEMEANIDKCAILRMHHPGNRENDPQVFTWKNNSLPYLQEYKYLGVMFDVKTTWQSHIERLIKKADIAFARLRPYLCDSSISIDLRLRAFDALITPLFSYASESWAPLTKQTRSKMARWVQRKYKNNRWKRRK